VKRAAVPIHEFKGCFAEVSPISGDTEPWFSSDDVFTLFGSAFCRWLTMRAKIAAVPLKYVNCLAARHYSHNELRREW
jgi:hypothetical protein